MADTKPLVKPNAKRIYLSLDLIQLEEAEVLHSQYAPSLKSLPMAESIDLLLFSKEPEDTTKIYTSKSKKKVLSTSFTESRKSLPVSVSDPSFNRHKSEAWLWVRLCTQQRGRDTHDAIKTLVHGLSKVKTEGLHQEVWVLMSRQSELKHQNFGPRIQNV